MKRNPVETIARKRDGLELSTAEIAELIEEFSSGQLPDYQMAAFAMAVFCRGMTPSETAALTDSMLRSGTVLSWPAERRPVVDKHSTGGVGDKVSLVLAPLLACCGVRVPMISGRGLGPTGGTLDKLESIPGYRTDLSLAEIRDCTERVGCVITGATAEIAPADKRLYALRDVTGTVPSIPLITASIMSKKLAAGLQALVLDVKWGSGAFMKTQEQARALARSLVATGKRMGVATTAFLTDMNQPLGRRAGNAVEVAECVEILQGGGPAEVWEVTLALGGELLVLAGVAADSVAARSQLTRVRDSGAAWQKFVEMVTTQGGRLEQFQPVRPSGAWRAREAGWLAAVDTEQLGWAVIEMGGGRRSLSDVIDPTVGLEMVVRLGNRVEVGEDLVLLYGDLAARERAEQRLARAFCFSPEPVSPPALILERLTE